jgi:acid phosphatase type 7
MWDYFGARAGPPGRGYYSFDIGRLWHVIVLNDNASLGGPPPA